MKFELPFPLTSRIATPVAIRGTTYKGLMADQLCLSLLHTIFFVFFGAVRFLCIPELLAVLVSPFLLVSQNELPSFPHFFLPLLDTSLKSKVRFHSARLRQCSMASVIMSRHTGRFCMIERN